MNLPVSERLKACAALVPAGARVADVGADHGYLGIYLLLCGIARHVTATDVRSQPLSHAQENAARFGVDDRMTFALCDGLAGVRAGSVDTIVIAGMGGDTIAHILHTCDWADAPGLTWILQPNTSANDLRRDLGERGWRIEHDRLVQEGGFLYNLLSVRAGGGAALSPGQQYVSPQLLAEGGALLDAYFARVLQGLARAVEGIARSSRPDAPERLRYYGAALREVTEMRDLYANRAGD